LDCIDVSSASSAEIDLFASLEGIVNRTQPQVACVSSGDGEGEFTWLKLHNLPYNLTNGYNAILKYRTNFTGLVVTDPSMAHTLNLATTMAGVNNELICDPSLLATLTNAPYNLPVVDDLRGRFADKYAVYGYLYTNYWAQCTHRIIAGMGTNLDGNLRDYLVAMKVATVWLDPGTLNFQDKSTLALFLSGMTAANGVYIGWWPSEGNGLTWIASYGIPVLASDWFRNGSVFSGVTRPINIPDIPPPPPLENKVYVALILSDGDNIQYMQHVMKMDWGNAARGSVPIGWTTESLAADMDPVMFSHYWGTVTTNDCLISGPSGAGYTHMELWNTANLTAFASLSDAYLQRSGLRIITIWDNVTTAVAQNFATNCPTLLGLTDQGSHNGVDRGLRTIALTPTYASTLAQMISGITNASTSWNGTAPLFIAAQATVWSLGPADMLTIANTFDTNKFKFVRPDHLFLLANRVFGPPVAMTQSAVGITAGSASLQGMVTGNATNAIAWLEWGTNRNYGSKSAVTNVGNLPALVNASITGLKAQQIYHYRVAASNVLGVAWGADRQFTTGGRLKVWGSGAFGETNVPAGLTNLVGIAGGANHGLGLKNDGNIVAWGYNNFGQTNVPAGLSNVIAIAGGLRHSLALMSNGTVAAWGDNTYGQTNVPMGLTNVVAIAAGAYHNLALKADQTMTAWGYNVYGQTNTPAGLTNIVGIAAGYGHNLALKSDGTVAAWGYNNLGQTNVPAGLNHAVTVAAGQYHSLVLKADGISAANNFPASRWVADSLTGSDGSSVGNWTDSVGGKSAAQTVTINQPKLYSGVLNGHKTVRFASANSQYLTVASGDSPVSGAADFTLAVVFKTATPGNSSSSFFQNTGLIGCEQPNTVTDWALCLNGSLLGAGLGAGGSGCSSDVSLYGGNVADGNPHIAMYVRSGSTIRLYVDGVIVAEQPSLCTLARGNYDFQIGAMTTNSWFFTGDIAEIQIYKKALNYSEVMSADGVLANTYGMSGIAGAPMSKWVADSLAGADGSTISNWNDAIGGKSAAQAIAGNRPRLYSNVLNGHKTVRFASGSSQYLTVTAAGSPISSAGSFTSVVVFKTSTPGNASSSFYLNTGLLGAEQPGVVADWAFCINGSQLGAGLGGGTGGCGSDLSLYGGTVTDGNPHIAMYVRAGETISLYVDGAVVATQTSLCTSARGNYPFQIGAMTTSSYFFNGDIAEIQVYNRALNSWEIMSANEALAATYGVGGAAGMVVAWGNNGNGQTNVPKNLPAISAVAGGGTFNLALAASGTVFGWGYNGQGQISIPAGLTNVAAIAGGTNFSLAIGNQPPVANNGIFPGYVNHDLALTLPATSPDGTPLNYRILSLPVAGALYQYAGGSRGPLINSPNTLVSDPGGQIIFAPAPGDMGNPYATFNFMCDDGLYSSAVAQVTVNIGFPAVPQFTGALWSQTDPGSGSFNLNFSGDSNATYSVWAATDLAAWVKIGTATEAPPGWYQFIDATATNWPQRFYRLSAP
jgi:alpha-tubulin suppressor-like RCC1 family protein